MTIVVYEGKSNVSTSRDDVDGTAEVLEMEHLSMASIVDSSLKIDVPHNHFVVNLLYNADTYQVRQNYVVITLGPGNFRENRVHEQRQTNPQDYRLESQLRWQSWNFPSYSMTWSSPQW